MSDPSSIAPGHIQQAKAALRDAGILVAIGQQVLDLVTTFYHAPPPGTLHYSSVASVAAGLGTPAAALTVAPNPADPTRRGPSRYCSPAAPARP